MLLFLDSNKITQVLTKFYETLVKIYKFTHTEISLPYKLLFIIDQFLCEIVQQGKYFMSYHDCCRSKKRLFKQVNLIYG